MLEGKPFSQLLGESQGRAERFSESAVAQPLKLQADATSSAAKNQFLKLALFTFPLRLTAPLSGSLSSITVQRLKRVKISDGRALRRLPQKSHPTASHS